MTGEWIPLQFRERGVPEDHLILVEGVPKWLRPSLWHWLEGRLLGYGGSGMRAFVQRMERKLRRDLGSQHITRDEASYWGDMVKVDKTPPAVARLHTVLNGDDDLFLEAVDLALHQHTSQSGARDVRNPDVAQLKYGPEVWALSGILDQGGSIWSVMWPFPKPGYLARRATQVTQQQVANMASGHGRPGDHLTEAWRFVFGRSPNPSSGYKEAVRAVEAAAKPALLPREKTATLGKMYPALRDGWKNFVVELGGIELRPQERAVIVADMMRLLWKGEFDRHGTDEEDVPPTVSQEQAEAAAHMALLLVEWFQTGAVRRAEE